MSRYALLGMQSTRALASRSSAVTYRRMPLVQPSSSWLTVRTCSTRSTDYIGIHFDEKSGTWQSVMEVNGKKIKGGSFNTQEEAAKSYDVLAQIFDDDAVTNFVQSESANWVPPKDDKEARQIRKQRIEVRHRQPLELEESVTAIEGK